MKKTFEPGKNAKELDINTTKVFEVIKESGYFKVGERIKLKEDDGSNNPFFRKEGSKDVCCMYWDELAYADEPECDCGIEYDENRYPINHFCEKHKKEEGQKFKEEYLGKEPEEVAVVNRAVFSDTNEKLSKITEWLYINDGGYPSKIAWRIAFIKMLKETL